MQGQNSQRRRVHRVEYPPPVLDPIQHASPIHLVHVASPACLLVSQYPSGAGLESLPTDPYPSNRRIQNQTQKSPGRMEGGEGYAPSRYLSTYHACLALPCLDLHVSGLHVAGSSPWLLRGCVYLCKHLLSLPPLGETRKRNPHPVSGS